MTSPNVVFNYNFELAVNSPDRNNKNTKEQIVKSAQGLFDYYNKDSKYAINLFDYYSGDINKKDKMNIMLENGKMATPNQIELRRKEYGKYILDRNLARCVVSFNNDYINNKMDIVELEKRMVKHIIPMYLKKCGFKDINKMSYQISLHTDTDNLHFHFSYLEEEPKKYFKPTEKNFFLNDKEDLVLEANILKLGEMIYRKRNDKDGRIKYNSINDKEIEELTKNIKNYLFSKKNPDFKNEITNFRNSINKLNDYFIELGKKNNIKDINIDTSLIDRKNEDLDNYIYNAIVNHADFMYKTKVKNNITENKIIEEIVYKNYLKTKRRTRASILKNYFNGTTNKNKFKTKYKIEEAIKNINNEMEDAQKEFSKLFKSNSYEK